MFTLLGFHKQIVRFISSATYLALSHNHSLYSHSHSPSTVTQLPTFHCLHSHSPYTVTQPLTLHCHTVTHLALFTQSLTLHCHTVTHLTLSHNHSPCTVTVAQSEESLCPIQLPATQLNLPDSSTLEGVSLSTPVVFLLKSLFCLRQVNQEAAGLPGSVRAWQVNDTCPPVTTVTLVGSVVA